MKRTYSSLRRAAQLGLISLALFISTGCSTFHRDWRKAGAVPAPADDMSGRWEGRWQSQVTGHTDRLRCLVTKQENGRYQARFHAKYRRIFSFGYTVPLRVQVADGVFQFKGDANLGRLAGGKYSYEGHATATNFFSTYRAAGDHGTFRLSRP